MNINRKSLWLLTLVPLMAACGVDRGYNAKPVVGSDDPRSTPTPDIGDPKAREEQNCFMIEIYGYGLWTNTEKDEGIACMVTPTTEGANR